MAPTKTEEPCKSILAATAPVQRAWTCNPQINVRCDFVFFNHFPSLAVEEVADHHWAVSALSSLEAELLR